ncbi:MAG: CDP-alcohol phosphatidyltransferase family protein [Planctomycetes bacterium]|nr:CDP-alcohol phosphatidyltransferase family protein [Planctomycetota bacterium]
MELSWANQITIGRIFLIAPFVICMLKASQSESEVMMRYIALVIFLAMCISDALDGYVARVKKQVTKLGAFLDPMADKLLMTCACVLLASPKTAIEGFVLPPTVVVLIIGKDILLLLGFIVVYFITSQVRIVLQFAGKAATFLQLSMVVAILIAPEVTPVLGIWPYFLRVLWWSAAVIAVLTTLVYIRSGILYIEAFEGSRTDTELEGER